VKRLFEIVLANNQTLFILSGMKSTLSFDFTDIDTVKSSIELAGRGIQYLATQLDGTRVYLVTWAARQKLIAKYGGTYTNDNNQAVAL
jgi:hypothetical protein